jgi:hypothetical protein
MSAAEPTSTAGQPTGASGARGASSRATVDELIPDPAAYLDRGMAGASAVPPLLHGRGADAKPLATPRTKQPLSRSGGRYPLGLSDFRRPEPGPRDLRHRQLLSAMLSRCG